MRHPRSSAIDAEAWPGVATVPAGRLVNVRARLAEAAFARACDAAGLDLDPTGEPDLVVEHEGLFARLAVAGWLGLAESYLAGEWHADELVDVLAALLSAGYRPRAGLPRGRSLGGYTGGELPTELVRLSSGDGMSAFGGVFATGVPTTVRTAVPSHVPGGRGPDTHFIDLTTISEPTSAERDDLGDAQARAVTMLLDAARVTAGTHLLEFPSTGGAVAIGASSRRATVDTLTADQEQARVVRERLMLAGVDDAVSTQVIDHPVPGPRDVRGRFDAIVSVDQLHVLAPSDRVALVRGFDRLLTIGGNICLQTVVATDAMTHSGRAAIDALSAYIWPDLDYPTTTDIHRLVDRESGLRVVGQTHLGSHTELSLAMQHSLFDAHAREAAAAGFDVVFRRLWDYQFALRQALFRLGMLDAVQVTLTHRNRRGRR